MTKQENGTTNAHFSITYVPDESGGNLDHYRCALKLREMMVSFLGTIYYDARGNVAPIVDTDGAELDAASLKYVLDNFEESGTEIAGAFDFASFDIRVPSSTVLFERVEARRIAILKRDGEIEELREKASRHGLSLVPTGQVFQQPATKNGDWSEHYGKPVEPPYSEQEKLRERSATGSRIGMRTAPTVREFWHVLNELNAQTLMEIEKLGDYDVFLPHRDGSGVVTEWRISGNRGVSIETNLHPGKQHSKEVERAFKYAAEAATYLILAGNGELFDTGVPLSGRHEVFWDDSRQCVAAMKEDLRSKGVDIKDNTFMRWIKTLKHTSPEYFAVAAVLAAVIVSINTGRRTVVNENCVSRFSLIEDKVPSNTRTLHEVADFTSYPETFDVRSLSKTFTLVAVTPTSQYGYAARVLVDFFMEGDHRDLRINLVPSDLGSYFSAWEWNCLVNGVMFTYP